MLVGNKTDLEEEREVTFEVGLETVIKSQWGRWEGPQTHVTTHSHSHTCTHDSKFSFLPGPRFLISPGKVRPRDGGFQLWGEP